MNYKVGDKVRVREDLEVGKWYGGLIWFSGMDYLRGLKSTITKKEGRDYNLKNANGPVSPWWLSDEMLEPAEEKSTIEKINDKVREITILAQDERIRYLEKEIAELKGELKPCPHCGSTAAPVCLTAEEIDGDCDGDTLNKAVVCDSDNGGCGATGGYADNKKEAVEKWNRRV